MALHKKRGVGATPEAKAKRIAALRAVSTKPQTMEGYASYNADRPLTEKQKNFAILWAQGENPKNAAVKAGFSANSTVDWKLRQDPAILKLYNEEKAKYERAGDMSRQKFMDGLTEAMEMARLMSDPQAMVAALRQVGLACGYFEPTKVKLDISVKGNIMVDRLKTLSDAELLRLIEAPVIEGVAERVDDGGDDDPSA